MNLLFLAWRNIVSNLRRSLALGIFALLSGAIFVLINAYLFTITSNMKAALVNSLTGDIQFRSSTTQETDMLPFKNAWNDLGKLNEAQAKAIADAFRDQKDVQVIRRVRTTALLSAGSAQEPALVVGLQPGFTAYQKALTLIAGRPLDPAKNDEIIISKKQAEALGVGVGDTIALSAVSLANGQVQPGAAPGGASRAMKARVVGIGELTLFDLYGIFFTYTNLGTAQELVGVGSGDFTDVILFLPPNGDLDTFVDKATRIDQGMKVTTREDSGDFIMGGIQLFSALFYGFISIFLLIIGLLITNMVFSIGMERRREIGTLRAIGFSRAAIVTLFVGEIGMVGAVFTVVGVALGTGIVLLLAQVGLEPTPPLVYLMGKPFYMQLRVMQVVWPVLIISGFSALAAFLPAVRAASVRPVEVMAEN